jgi:hypothetical protein
LDVDLYARGLGLFYPIKMGRKNVWLLMLTKFCSLFRKGFTPMEGESYALIWGIMHFFQFLYCNHFALRTDHKLLEWSLMHMGKGDVGLTCCKTLTLRSYTNHALNIWMWMCLAKTQAKEDEKFSQ